MNDSLTISYLKGEITFEDYANIIENQNLSLELANENVIEYTNSTNNNSSNNKDNAQKSSKSVKQGNNSKNDLDEYMNMLNESAEYDFDDGDLDDTNDDDLWDNFDVGTLNFDKFIEKSDNQKEKASTSKSAAFKEPPSRKRKRDNNTDEDPAELKSKRRRNRVLPIEIQGLMGEANLSYIRGEKNKAIDICTEVIKHAPKAPEPYKLLSWFYREIGDTDKSLRVGLIAAQLNKDPEEWIQLIQQSSVEGNEELVLFCYNNVIQCSPQNIDLHLERIRLLEDKNDTKRLVLAKMMLLKYINVETHMDLYNKYFNELINELNDNEKTKKIYVLRNDLKKFKEKFPLERLVQLIKLLIDQTSYKEAIITAMNQCYIAVKGPNQLDFNNLENLEFEVPSYCDQHIRTLFIVALISLEYKKEDALLAPLIQKENDKYGPYYLLIANKYYEKCFYEKAKFYFNIILTKINNASLKTIDIWLKYGNCCSNLDEIDNAIDAYRNAVQLDSSNCEAAIALVEALKKRVLFDEASVVIKKTLLSHEKSLKLSVEILSLRISECVIHFERGNYAEFIKCAETLLFGGIPRILDNENINALLRCDSKAQRILVFHQVLDENDYKIEFDYTKIDRHFHDGIYQIYHNLCNILIKTKRYNEFITYSVAATVLPFIYERMDWIKPINFTCLIACILKCDGRNGFNILRDFIIENKNSNKLWSYVCIVISLYPSLNQQKFFIRLSAKNMDHLPLCLINAHFAIMSGTYRYALVEYMNCFKQNPTDPFINLIISITYCHISCQKYNTKRHLLVTQSLVFLRRYMQYRGLCQETYYNVARVMHQLSLFDLAARFYRKCLSYSCPFEDQKEIYDLRRFAAYNLISIYKNSGSLTLARRIMKDYLTI